MNDYEEGFKDAVDQILKLASEQANTYAKIHTELHQYDQLTREFNYKALAIMDFKLLILQKFSNHHIESDNQMG